MQKRILYLCVIYVRADLRKCHWYYSSAYQICIGFDNIVILRNYNNYFVHACMNANYMYVKVRH